MTWRPSKDSTLLVRFRQPRPITRLAALAGVVAILLQTILPVVHHPLPSHGMAMLPASHAPALDEAAVGYVAAFGEAALHLLCLGDPGARDDGAPSKPDGTQKLPPCPVCQAAQLAGSFLPPDGAPSLALPRITSPVALALADAAPPRTGPLGAQQRAPPARI